MKALLSKAAGGPESLVLEDVASPQPGPGQVVIDVAACAVNFPDVLLIADKYQERPQRPFSPGGEFSGVVAKIGEGVTNVEPGDRVMTCFTRGGMAEEAVVDASLVVKMPDSMSFEDGAALMITYGTSHHAFKDRARLQSGETLLVLGAAGGVGLSAVALGKAMGARVVAAVSTAEKAEFCKANGADAAVVYGRGPFDTEGKKQLSQLFRDATGPDGPDVIYDAVGGDYAEPALRAIACEGRYLVIGFAAGDIPKIPLNLPLLRGCDIMGVLWGAWVRRNPEPHRRNMAEILALYDAGKIRPHVSERYPLARGAEAIARLANRMALGKIVVTMD